MKQAAWKKQSKSALLMGTALAMSSMSQANAANENIQQIQTWLTLLCFEPGPIDGSYGGRTKQALKEFYQGRGGSYDGDLSANEVQDLDAAVTAAGIIEEKITLGTAASHSECMKPITKSAIQFSLTNLSPKQRFTYPEQAYLGTMPHGMAVFDVDDDGANEVYLSFQSINPQDYPDTPNVVFARNDGKIDDVTQRVFGGDVPTSSSSAHINFSDLNGDGKDDLVYSESGNDLGVVGGNEDSIEVLINVGSSFRRITSNFEAEISDIRSYATVVGNIDEDEYGEVVLSSGMDFEKSVVLHFDADGNAEIRRNPFLDSYKHNWNHNSKASNFVVADFDSDGVSDIYVGGQWATETNSVLWSGLKSREQAYLPETFLGWLRWGEVEVGSGGDVTSTVAADFDNDGDLDLVSGIERVYAVKANDDYNIDYSNGSILQILAQGQSREFEDVTRRTGNDLGLNYIQPMIVYDLNSDGLKDIVVNYWMKDYFILKKELNWEVNNLFGSMFLINRGGMRFEQQLASEMQGYDQQMEGMIFPLSTDNGKTSVMVLQPRSGGGGAAERYVDGYLADLSFD